MSHKRGATLQSTPEQPQPTTHPQAHTERPTCTIAALVKSQAVTLAMSHSSGTLTAPASSALLLRRMWGRLPSSRLSRSRRSALGGARGRGVAFVGL